MVSVSSLEIVATHPITVLEMADHRLYSGTTSRLGRMGIGDTPEL
jgi:hypothetical protein